MEAVPWGAFAQALVDESSEALLALSPEGVVLSWGNGARALFGYAADEAVGRSIESLIVPDERREEERGALARSLAAGSATLATVRRRKDGSPVATRVSMRAAGGAATGRFIAVCERRDGAGEDWFRTLLESAPDAMIVADGDGRIIHLNRQTEKLFGYARDELLGRPVEVLVPERFRGAHLSHRHGYAREPRVRPIGGPGLDLYGRRSDGSEFPAEISLSPVPTEKGMLVASAIRDVSDRRRLDSELRAANRELEAFGYSVAHDLRAPLRAMHAFAKALLDDHRDKLDADARDCLDEIHKNAMRMTALVDALLSLSRMARGELRPETVDVAAVARAVAARLSAAEPRAVEWVVHDGLAARLDPRLARSLVDNLLENAWKFTRRVAAPRIEVGSLQQAGERVFFVRDNGAGFDMAQAGKLFAPFQRLHPVGDFPGTGIGLATAQRIVHRHGGRIWAESAEGAGATFYFTVPGEGP